MEGNGIGVNRGLEGNRLGRNRGLEGNLKEIGGRKHYIKQKSGDCVKGNRIKMLGHSLIMILSKPIDAALPRKIAFPCVMFCISASIIIIIGYIYIYMYIYVYMCVILT